MASQTEPEDSVLFRLVRNTSKDAVSVPVFSRGEAMRDRTLDRREFVKAGLAASLGSTVAANAAGAKQRRPNVLYVFSDQHRAVSLPGEPFSDVVAPNIDAFRRANFSMDTCVSNYPLCTPYRGILMTGKYPCQSGLVRNGLQMRATERTLTQTFKTNGYRTGYVGKWHLGKDRQFIPPGPLRFGVDDWHVWAATNKHYDSWTFDPNTGQKLTPPGWNATAMTDQAVAFVKAQPAGPDAKPWMLMVSWNPPHPPFNPPESDQQPYAASLKRRPNVRLARDTDSSEGGAKKRAGKRGGGHETKALMSNAGLHHAMQGYFGGITGVDLEFKRLLEALDETGQADDTIVIYTSDHGEMMGSQGRMAKQVPFEESCRVPFSVRYPGVTARGGSSKALFGAIDIYPTVCGLAGLPVPAHCAGQDMSAQIRGERVSAKQNDMVFLMCNGHEAAAASDDASDEDAEEAGGSASKAPEYRGCRTTTHTYAVDTAGRWLLFDNVADPYQLNNLAHDAAHRPLMEGFDVRIKAWMKSTHDPFPYPNT